MKDKLAAIASLVVTAVLSTCCTLPLALASLGLGSLSLGSLIHPLRPYMIGLSCALITFGLIRVYSRPSTKKNRIFIWVAGSVFLVVVATPYVATYVREGADDPTPDPPGTRRLVVQLNDLEYASCCEGPAKETLGALPGVRRVRIHHWRQEAVLVVDQDAEIDNAMVSAALRAVDYTGHLKSP
ncbi:MAG TPA: hypothetical protein VKU80_02390 [Planctomycetota bacterium]|nr:hypothetical protein [Planctomycetota bacterium]